MLGYSKVRKCYISHISSFNKRLTSFFSDDPADSINYYFIEDFCGDSDEIDVYESLFIRSNGVAQVARFGLESFAFAHDTLSSIYLHCNVSKFNLIKI